MFSKRDLRRLLIPLIVEQLLTALMGMVDTIMVAKVGPAAVSAVSLVDTINLLMIYVLSALATGGTIVCAQYIGRKDAQSANHAARQVVLVVSVVAVVLTAGCLIFRKSLLQLIFGGVEERIMTASLQYFLFTAMSYPFIGLFGASSALCRAEGNSKTPMLVSAVANGINIAGNAVLIFVFDMGVSGAAIATLASRVFSAAVMLVLQRRPGCLIQLDHLLQIRPDRGMIRLILRIGIPAGFENGLFQFGKLAVQSTVSTLSTTAISAQAMVAMLEGATSMPSLAVGLGLMTIAGQCMGAGKLDQTKYYTKKLCGLSQVLIVISTALMVAVTLPVAKIGGMSPEATKIMWDMSVLICIVKSLIWVPAFTIPNAMRASGDVKFCAIVSSVTMWLFRVVMTWILCRHLGFGVLGVWLGWFADWLARMVIFLWRWFSGRWTNHHVLD
ncbi:MAG: MATE family efflux transporter [Oscillospiraceae bacterium]|nr:MATE family efflux transporter [Oscillospiraceae bacterium]